MPKLNDTDLSELEREFELEMEEEPTEELELEEDLDTEFEEEPEGEFEEVEEESAGDYAERLYELSQREFESEMELDDAMNEPLRQMEEEFFIHSAIKKGWKQLKKRGLGRLAKKALKIAAGKIPALQALKNATSAARAALRGDIGGLVKSGLGAALKAHPAGAALSPALSALGFEAGEDNREAWDNVVNVAREAYDRLAESMHENADDPLEASRLATNAFQSALNKVSAQKPYIASTGKRRRVIKIRKGDVLVIKVE